MFKNKLQNFVEGVLGMKLSVFAEAMNDSYSNVWNIACQSKKQGLTEKKIENVIQALENVSKEKLGDRVLIIEPNDLFFLHDTNYDD